MNSMESLIGASRDLFISNGFNGTTLRMLTEKLNITESRFRALF